LVDFCNIFWPFFLSLFGHTEWELLFFTSHYKLIKVKYFAILKCARIRIFPVETRVAERGRLYLFGHGNLKQLDNSENDMYVCLIHMALIRPHFSPKRCAVVAAVVSGPSKQVVWVQISQAVKCQEIFFKAAA
jgi:hypothetical protein